MYHKTNQRAHVDWVGLLQKKKKEEYTGMKCVPRTLILRATHTGLWACHILLQLYSVAENAFQYIKGNGHINNKLTQNG